MLASQFAAALATLANGRDGKIHSLQLHTCNPDPNQWQLVVTWLRQTPMGTTLETLPYTWEPSDNQWYLVDYL